MFNILIPDRTEAPAELETNVFPEGTNMITPNAEHASEISDQIWQSSDAILAWHDLEYDAEVIGKLDNCKVLVRMGAGYDNVDLSAAAVKGIKVCNVPDYGTEDVADHAIGLLWSLFRGLFRLESAARAGEWSWEIAPNLERIKGKTLGIIGLGRIGTATALRAKALGLNVIFYDPAKVEGFDKSVGLTRVRSLKELANQSQAVSLHVDLNETSQNIINQEFVSEMNPGSFLINVSRGGTMDLDAVWWGLKEGILEAVGLDVLPIEPPPEDHPLIQAWRSEETEYHGRIVITPHSASQNIQAMQELRIKGAEEAWRVLSGESARNCVNSELMSK
jgi:C-terminal binding protein